MNKVILMGRLTRDPEIRYTQGDQPMAVARYSLAVDRRGRGQNGEQSADFINCVAFGKNAEVTEKYLHKGDKLLVAGRIQTGSYTNRDGQRVYTTDVVIEEQNFVSTRNASGTGMQSRPAPSDAYSPDANGFINIPDGVDDEELPFH